jgi:hypothetical protein
MLFVVPTLDLNKEIKKIDKVEFHLILVMEIVDSIDINYGLNAIDLIQMQNLAQLLVIPN